MARTRSVRAEVLDGRRLTGVDLLAVRAMLTMIYPTEPRGAHWGGCKIDASLCSFDVGVSIGGSCPTCVHMYEEIILTLSCSCGARSSKREIDSIALPNLLAKMHEIAVADGLNATLADVAGAALVERFDKLDDEREEARERLYEYQDEYAAADTDDGR